MTEPAIVKQPAPKPNSNPPIVTLVMRDLAIRADFGKQKYGVALQAHNGRDALVDAYQETLDLACYLKQAIEERNVKPIQTSKLIESVKLNEEEECTCPECGGTC